MDANPPNTYWFFLNETSKPFNSLKARQAVNYAIDSRALQRIFGGRLEPTCNFLPPSYSKIGYKKIDPCPYGDPAGPGDIAKAKQLVEESGMKGEEVTVWGNSKEPRPAITEYLRDVMTEIGFKAKTQILDASRSTSVRSATARPGPRRDSPTGTRTSRTRLTSSSRTCPLRRWNPTRRSTSSSRATRSWMRH